MQDPRLTGRQAVLRIPVPAVAPGGHRGEVTVAFIPQKRDIAGLHAAIGITYRPPSTHNLAIHARPSSHVVTPPTTPGLLKTAFHDLRGSLSSTNSFLMPPSPPASSHSLRSYRSASSINPSTTSTHLPGDSSLPRSRPISALYSTQALDQSLVTTARQSATKIPSTTSHCHPISVIFSPHGISYSELEPYATSHLVAEAALPLTALLHCMHSVDNPWWLGGNINTGTPGGAVIAAKLGARVWVGAHDGDKDVRGLVTGKLKTRKFGRVEMRQVVAKVSWSGSSPYGAPATPPQSPTRTQDLPQALQSDEQRDRGSETEIMMLSTGDEVLVSGDGTMLWGPDIADLDTKIDDKLHKKSDPNQLGATPMTAEHGSATMMGAWGRKQARLKARASMSFLTQRLRI